MDGIVQIYQHNGIKYIKIQEFNTTLNITSLVMNTEKLFASGNSVGIHVYELNGTGY